MRVSINFYESVIANSEGAARIKSMQRIRAACDSLEKKCGQVQYTIADVGRYCEQRWGGPKAQSIRNSPAVLARYIRLRIAEHVMTSSHAAYPVVEPLDLADATRAQEQYLLALAEIERLHREIAKCRARIDGYREDVADELVEMSKLRD